MDKHAYVLENQLPDMELDLRLFDGEGGGGAATGATSAPGAPAAEAKPAESTTPGAAKKKSAKNALNNVQYGKQATEPAADAAEREPKDANAEGTEETAGGSPDDEFEELIKSKYKDQFTKRFQREFDARFKAHKQNEELLKKVQPILEALGSKMGVDPGDVDKIAKAIDSDDSFYENEAADKGYTVEQLKEVNQLKRENERLSKAREEMEKREAANQITQRWQQESAKCKEVYRSFDFAGEWNHAETGQRFQRLLKSGIDVETAYKTVHINDLLGGAIRQAVQTTQKKTTDTIKARGMRPSENGASGAAAAKTVKSDPTSWTKADRAEVSRRVRRGERIVL
ncbi:MAG: hypothetical protein JW811_00725 [Clostridiales bacterium]|nr:hypothetical protein [Clostridiales bacterium]